MDLVQIGNEVLPVGEALEPSTSSMRIQITGGNLSSVLDITMLDGSINTYIVSRTNVTSL